MGSGTHLEGVEVGGHDVGPHLGPVDDVAAELGVPTHGAGARALVVALVDVLGGQGELAEALQERLRRLHFWFLVSPIIPGFYCILNFGLSRLPSRSLAFSSSVCSCGIDGSCLKVRWCVCVLIVRRGLDRLGIRSGLLVW